MANVGSIQTSKGQQFTSAHVLSQSRAGLGYHVLSGCDVNQASTPAMSVVVDPGYIQATFGTARKTVSGGTLTIAASDATYPRLDVIYVDGSGSLGVYAGTPTAISPASKTDFKEMSTPSPGTSIPTGVILALVYVGANVTTVTNSVINDIATYGPYCVESPTSTTSGKVPYWSGTAKTLSDGYSVGTSANNLLLLDAYGCLPLSAITTGTLGQTIVKGSSGNEWRTRSFDVAFTFGDGSTTILASTQSIEIPISCNITSAKIRSYNGSGTLVSGSATCTLYAHDIGASIGSSVDVFSLSSASTYSETGLSIAVTANQWLTVVISSITTCSRLTLSLTMEGT